MTEDLGRDCGIKFKVRYVYKWPWPFRKLYEFYYWIRYRGGWIKHETGASAGWLK